MKMSEAIEGELIETSGTEMIEAISRSEHDTKVSTAKRYPRSVKVFKQQTMELATLDEETAALCFYALPRGSKIIEGPSIRFAEIVAACYGNIQYGSRIVACDDKFVTAQGMAYDYEKNIACSIETKRKITDKNGVRFKDDMIQTTGQAACAIAMREAIFKIIPRAYWVDVLEKAKRVSIGDGKTIQKQRDDCFAYWRKCGAKDSDVLTFLDRKGIDDVTTDDLVLLRGCANAMKEEGLGWDRVLVRNETESSGVNRIQVKKNEPPKVVQP
jgi:hypothetical protein